MLDYFLDANVTGVVSLEIKDVAGQLVRRYASDDVPKEPDRQKLNIPLYWIRPPQPLSAAPGWHRFLWDLHYTPVPGLDPQYPMSAIYKNTAPAATGPWAVPGNYSVVLT